MLTIKVYKTVGEEGKKYNMAVYAEEARERERERER
jgi:hypothetical protein